MLILGSASGKLAAAPRLPSYNADLARTTVSGISSGGFMATQFHVAYSSIVVGAGIIAGGPYFCAGTSAFRPFQVNAMTSCLRADDEPPDAGALLERAKEFAQAGLIDPLVNLQRARVYLFHGGADRVVAATVVDQAAAFYRQAGVNASHLQYVRNANAGHAMVTNHPSDRACGDTAPPFINNCGFMLSHQLLRHLYDKLNPPAAAPGGTLIRFDQREFASGPALGMDDTGYAYVPRACQQTRCMVHVVFHGCAQGRDAIGERFARSTGYNELADSNQIIVLYPQVRSSQIYPYNPQGCWDFWGYASVNPYLPDFYTKHAPQMAAVRAMLARLAAPRKRAGWFERLFR